MSFYIASLDQITIPELLASVGNTSGKVFMGHPKAKQERQAGTAPDSFIEIVLLTSGHVIRECNFNSIRVNPQDIHLSISGKPAFIKEMSSDAKGWYCRLPSSFLSSVAAHEHLTSEIELISSFLYQYPLRLNNAIFERLLSNLKFIDQLFRQAQPDYFLIYIYLLASIYEIKKMMQESNLDFYPVKAFSITKKYNDLLLEYIETEQQIDFYAEQLQVSPNHLNKSVKAVTDKTAIELLNEVRLLEAQRRLKTTSLSVAEIAFKLGFDDPSYFSRFFKKRTGKTPGEFRESD